MHVARYLVFFVAAACSVAFGNEGDVSSLSESGDEAVVALTQDSFYDFVNSKETVLVEFYAPWCGHCKQLAPEFEKAAKILLADESPVALVKVDATVEKDLATRFDIGGYPTLKFFRSGEAYDYDGPRNSDGIVEYMRTRASKGWRAPLSAVLTLTSTNFSSIIEKEELILVEFYAPWCGHCKRLAPVLEKAAQTLKWNTPSIPIAKVDATSEASLAKTYDVSGYPTLKIFRYGRPSEYKGSREESGIVEYMKKQHGDACKLVQDATVLKKSLAVDDVTLVGFFKSTQSSLYHAYQDAGNDLRDNYTMFYTLDVEAGHPYGVDEKSECVAVILPERLHSKEDEPRYYTICDVDSSAEDLSKFYGKHNTPLVGELTKENAARRYYKRPLCVLYVNVDWTHEYRDMTQAWRKKLLKVARLHKKDDITFALADEDSYDEELKGLGLDDSGSAFSVACFDAEGNKYPMEEIDEFDADDISAFVRRVVSGKAKPYLRSQIAPKVQKGPVTVVVGKTFKALVLDTAKDVLIELYAPWCGHCKQFEPELKKLAKELQQTEPNLVIAKMDATANDAPAAFAVSGFPTIYFVPASNKKPIMYEGNRDLADLKKFMSKHASVAFKGKEEL